MGDPYQFEESSMEQGNQPKESDADVVKCPSCGANMVFSAEKNALVCPYCDTSREVETTISYDRNYFDYMDEGEVDDTALSFRCPNCNAHTVFASHESAHECPFCGSTCIIDEDQVPGMKPDSLLPFCITKEAAVDFGKKWIKKRLFAPSKLKKSFVVSNIRGVYTPCFTFTSDTYSTYEGRLGKSYTVMVGSGKNRRMETRVRWFNVSGSLNKLFPNLLIESSSRLDQKTADKLGAFDIGNATGYNEEFLAGYSAERYDNSLTNCFDIAKDKMEKDLRQTVLGKYDHDRVDYLNVTTTYNTVRFRLILMPLWACGYYFKQKLYNFFVNGRTGKSAGKAPLSPIRVALAVLAGLAVIAGLVYLYLSSNGSI